MHIYSSRALTEGGEANCRLKTCRPASMVLAVAYNKRPANTTTYTSDKLESKDLYPRLPSDLHVHDIAQACPTHTES